MAGTSKKSRIVTFRMDNEVYAKARRLHPNLSEWLRGRVKYDLTRKHTKGRWNKGR